MIRRGAVVVVGGQRLGGRGRRAEGAEAVERMQRRQRLLAGLTGGTGSRRGRVAGDIDDPVQHFDECARHRQIGPAHIGADMEQREQPLAAMLAGDQRRAIFQRGPAPGRKHRIGFGEHLPAHRDVLGHVQSRERTVGRERGEMLRLLPGQAAAERTAAAAQFDRHEIVVALREPRAGETHQHAALIHPGREPVAKLGRERADVGHHDHRQLLIEELGQRLLRGGGLVAEPHVGEGRERAGQIEGRGQQRLRGVAGCAADDADRAATPALVEQLHRAGRTLAGNLEP